MLFWTRYRVHKNVNVDNYIHLSHDILPSAGKLVCEENLQSALKLK